MAKKAFITGITGQDGSYLSELLLEKDYEVHGLIRRSSTKNTTRIEHLITDNSIFDNKFFLHYGDLTDGTNISRLLEKINPDEIYHLGAQSHVGVSFETPEYTGNVSALGTTRLLEAIRETQINTKFYQASSSEMYGKVKEIPQTESTPFYPRSPYGCSKVYAYWTTVNYRESYNLFACNGILFNHESPRRSDKFVTKKITQGLVNIITKKQDLLYLGNLEAKRDWGYAKDYVEAMWLMLQQNKPDDYVIATGKTYSVKDFLNEASSYLNINWNNFVKIDPKLLRPSEVDLLVGNSTKAKTTLGWEPKVSFKELVKIMIDADLKNAGLTIEDIKKNAESIR